MSRSQNVFFCGGNNPLKYIPMWFPIGFSLALIYQDVLIPFKKKRGFFILICQRAQNVFFCGGNNPLKYIPRCLHIGFFFGIDLSGCPYPLW